MPAKKQREGMSAPMIHGFVEQTLGTPDRSKESSEVPFEKLDEEDQLAVMYELQSLVAERSDLIKSLNETKKDTAGQTQMYQMKRIGRRNVRVPVVAENQEESLQNPFSTTMRAAVERSQQRLLEVKQRLLELGKRPGLSEAYERKISEIYFVTKCLRKAEELQTRMDEIDAEIDSIQAQAMSGTSGAVFGVRQQRVDVLLAEKNKISEVIAAMDKYEAGHHAQRFAIIKEHAAQYNRGRIIEIPSVQRLVDEGLEHMRAHQPYMLAGHLGSGKTEVARHIARLFMLENGIGYDASAETDPEKIYDTLRPEIFSGAEESSIYDLIGKLKLTGKKLDASSASKRAEELESELQKRGIMDVPKAEIVKILLGQGNVTETLFAYGPLGRALRDGVPIIIDEINLMPPEVIARINDLLLRPVGSKIRLQENGEEEFEIKPGFMVISTLNVGRQYHGVRAFNAAFKSRWVGQEVDYPSVEETYDLILAALVRNDRPRLPPNFPAEQFGLLADLAMGVREIQELFSGQTTGQRFMAMAKSMAPEQAQLQRTVVSTRDLMRKILLPWKTSNFTKSLSEIIAKEILAPAGIDSKDDQAFMTEIFIRRGFFQEKKTVVNEKGEQSEVPIWNAKKFASCGVKSVADSEISALQAQMSTDAYKQADAFAEIATRVHANARSLEAGMLLGNRSA